MRGKRSLCQERKGHVEGVKEIGATIWLGPLRGTKSGRSLRALGRKYGLRGFSLAGK